MGNEEDRWRIRELLKSEKEGWKRDRLIALGMGFSPDNSLESIAATIGRSVPTVQRWFCRYRDEGLEAALTRGSSGGRPAELTDELAERLREGLASGRWNTAVQAQRELESGFGRRIPYSTLVRWLKNCAGVMRVPLPVYEK